MGVILGGALAAVVLAVGAGYVLRSYQEPAYERYTTPSVRVGDPGENLVGRDWSGEPLGVPGVAREEAAAE
jgi:hypothetical protein